MSIAHLADELDEQGSADAVLRCEPNEVGRQSFDLWCPSSFDAQRIQEIHDRPPSG